MPEIRRYVVTQTREVRVQANSAADAGKIAAAAFANGQNIDAGVKNGPEGIWGNTDGRIQETSLIVNKVR